jgi:hypothetical protein
MRLLVCICVRLIIAGVGCHTSIHQDAVMVNSRCSAWQVRRLMASRLEPGWRFSTLYLVKDSLGVMLEAAGLAEDALREFFELEATYLGSAAAGGGVSGHEPGAPFATYCCRAPRARAVWAAPAWLDVHSQRLQSTSGVRHQRPGSAICAQLP